MKILVTNDDGPNPWLDILVDQLDTLGHDVLVVVPGANCSGAAAAVHTDAHLCVQRKWRYMLLGGPPADCVRLSLDLMRETPDIVISGPNVGYNHGHLALHSGTVGAAATAAVRGIPGFAISVDADCKDPAPGIAAVLADIERIMSIWQVEEYGLVEYNVPANYSRICKVVGVSRGVSVTKMTSETEDPAWPDTGETLKLDIHYAISDKIWDPQVIELSKGNITRVESNARERL